MSERCIHGKPPVLPDHSLCCSGSAIRQSGNLGFDIVAELAESLHLSHIFSLDLEAKGLLDDDHDIHEIKAVDANVFLQAGLGFDLFFVKFKVFYQKILDFFFDFLSVQLC